MERTRVELIRELQARYPLRQPTSDEYKLWELFKKGVLKRAEEEARQRAQSTKRESKRSHGRASILRRYGLTPELRKLQNARRKNSKELIAS